MTDEQEAERGRLAKEVLDNEVYADAYVQIADGLIAVWREARSVEAREEAHAKLVMLDKVRSIIESTMRSGRVAAKELERKQTMAERLLRR